MTALQKVQLRLSEIRKRMAELAGLETLTDEQTAEVEQLRAEFGQCETRQQALLIAQEGEGEARRPPSRKRPRTANIGSWSRVLLSPRSWLRPSKDGPRTARPPSCSSITN